MPRARAILVLGVQLARGVLLARNLDLVAAAVEEFRPFIDKGHVGAALIEGEVVIGRVADVWGGANIAVDDEDTVAVGAWRGRVSSSIKKNEVGGEGRGEDGHLPAP